jgi:hypothetical protein
MMRSPNAYRSHVEPCWPPVKSARRHKRITVVGRTLAGHSRPGAGRRRGELTAPYGMSGGKRASKVPHKTHHMRVRWDVVTSLTVRSDAGAT